MLNISNKRPFTIPENYFDEFAAKMDDCFREQKSQKHIQFRRWFYGAAASFIGVILLGQALIIENENKRRVSETYEAYILSQVSESSIIDYYLASGAE